MAWTIHGSGNRAVVFSEVVDADQDKSFTMLTDALGYILDVRFIEILYVAFAAAGTRTLELTVVRDGETVHSMPLDSAAHPTSGETKRIYLNASGGVGVEAEITGAVDNHHHFLVPLHLATGDVLRIRDSAGINAGDDMHIFIHAEAISQPAT